MVRRPAAWLTGVGLLLLFVLPGSAGPGVAWLGPSDRIEDAAFWRMFSEFSEPSGYFQSDNLVSNERTFPSIMPEISGLHAATIAYVGVGPEQNFSYLAALKPRVAFIVDIRRQNAILHLLYKTLFEMAPNRAEFLSRLLSRPRPRGLSKASTVRDLFAAYAKAPSNPGRFEANLKDVRKRLRGHGFVLSEEDLGGLKYVYSAFFEAGPELQYSFGSSQRGRPFPTFAELMTSVDQRGVASSFLASEESYLTLRELERRNLIIPVVGNFAGPKALRSVSEYLRGRGLKAAVFYTSNVEQYLFRGEDWKGFYDNVAALPVDGRSVLVRSIFGSFGSFGGIGGALGPGAGGPGVSRQGRLHLDPIEDLVAAFRRGEVSSYGDVVARAR